MPHIIVKWYPGRTQAQKEAVYRPDILGKQDTLVRKPGYNPFKKAT